MPFLFPGIYLSVFFILYIYYEFYDADMTILVMEPPLARYATTLSCEVDLFKLFLK